MSTYDKQIQILKEKLDTVLVRIDLLSHKFDQLHGTILEDVCARQEEETDSECEYFFEEEDNEGKTIGEKRCVS